MSVCLSDCCEGSPEMMNRYGSPFSYMSEKVHNYFVGDYFTLLREIALNRQKI